MIVIPIVEETLDMIEELNGGVRPLIEKGKSTAVFVYKGPDTPPDIVPVEDILENKTRRILPLYYIK
jgi:hypothetical protein